LQPSSLLAAKCSTERVPSVTDWLTYEDVASQLRVGRSTVRRLVKSGDLRAVQDGPERRITRASFTTYVNRKFGKEEL
jgi:excisionase family DNA binding protein